MLEPISIRTADQSAGSLREEILQCKYLVYCTTLLCREGMLTLLCVGLQVREASLGRFQASSVPPSFSHSAGVLSLRLSACKPLTSNSSLSAVLTSRCRAIWGLPWKAVETICTAKSYLVSDFATAEVNERVSPFPPP